MLYIIIIIMARLAFDVLIDVFLVNGLMTLYL